MGASLVIYQCFFSLQRLVLWQNLTVRILSMNQLPSFCSFGINCPSVHRASQQNLDRLKELQTWRQTSLEGIYEVAVELEHLVVNSASLLGITREALRERHRVKFPHANDPLENDVKLDR